MKKVLALLVITACLFITLSAKSVAQPTEKPVETLPTGLSEQEQASLDKDKQNFADYISWIMLGGGVVVLAYGLYRLHRMLKD